ncbi:adenylate isopentenyltransferase 3, chloroplastic-like [Prosopis cineraria]|uniref:adenylate isopentenyltransferase 3, chloroplastic-like n=1 Tax=Prosopis cineraria TaxID=364024 RepID=UPI00241000A8|nr:adenylate isopentenyltransferase 3, chloroplastic-like [Prosopis cineraria]
MTITMVTCRLTQPLINISSVSPKINVTSLPRQKEKVLLVMGTTGAGKSRLSIDLATHFPAEIINSDKMQVYEGLDIVTNKIAEEEQRGVPHHLLGTENPNSEFTANNFCDMASLAIETIRDRGKLPIIVGGSNSFLEALIDDDDYKFRSRYDFCCVWVDAGLPDLYSYVAQRVDQMLEKGMVNELRPFYNPKGDYSRGIRKAIGVPEFDKYFRREASGDEETRRRLLEEAMREMKKNTWKLARKQLGKIQRLWSVKRWKIHRVDATSVFRKRGEGEENDEWRKVVAEPSAKIVAQFLRNSTMTKSGVAGGLRLASWESAIASSAQLQSLGRCPV